MTKQTLQCGTKSPSFQKFFKKLTVAIKNPSTQRLLELSHPIRKRRSNVSIYIFVEIYIAELRSSSNSFFPLGEIIRSMSRSASWPATLESSTVQFVQ